MEIYKIIIIASLVFLFVFIVFNINHIIEAFLKSLVRFEDYRLSIFKGINTFIALYKIEITKYTESVEDKNLKQEIFNKRFDLAVRNALRYTNRPFLFYLIECLLKRTKEEEELIKDHYFFIEFTNIINDIQKELP